MGARGWSLIGLMLVAAVVAWPSAARGADKVCVEHPAPQDDSVVCVRDNWQVVDICDRKADGHRVYARVVTKSTYPAYREPYYDSNDSAAGCSNLHFGSQVVSVAVCVQTKGCSGMKATGVAPPDNTTPPPTPTPTPPPPTPPPPTPPPTPPPPPPSSGGITVGIGLGCVRNGKRMRVTLKVRKQPGKAKPRVKRVVFYYRKNGSVVARSDRSKPYKRTLLIHLAPGPHHVYARVYYKRRGSSKLRKETVKRRFTVCA
jgi:hypothetical protein